MALPDGLMAVENKITRDLYQARRSIQRTGRRSSGHRCGQFRDLRVAKALAG
jgi:hypothetical protein